MDNRIRAFREAKGLSLDQLASLAGTSNQQISNLETGKRRLTVDWLTALGKALDCHPWSLIDDALMATGGLRTARGMADAIANDGFDLIGLARPLCLAPDAPAALLRGAPVDLVQPTLRIGSGWLGPKSPIKLIRTITGAGSATWYNEQILRLSTGQQPDRKLNFAGAFVRSQLRERRMAKALDT